MSINLNAAPYYDDFDKTKNYHKILFVPGRNVQARELTQIQTIIQHQIKTAGDFLHKNGSVVQPGECYFSSGIPVLELEASVQGVLTESILDYFKDVEIQNADGVKAKVIAVDIKTTGNPSLIIKYTSASPTSTNNTFSVGDSVSVVGNATVVATIRTTDKTASLAMINEGIYYLNGYYVQVAAHAFVFEIGSNTRTGYIGLKCTEEIVTASSDPTLYDLSDGYQNVAAPGADRLKISLNLFAYDSIENVDDTKFINLMFVKNGALQYNANYEKFGEIETILARRTFDESGNYTIKDFTVSVAEYRSNARGEWAAGTAYLEGDVVSRTVSGTTYFYVALDEGFAGTTAPVHTAGIVSDGSIDWLETKAPAINNGTTNVTTNTLAAQKEADAKGTYVISSGKAYINGFEVIKQTETSIPFDKPRKQSFFGATLNAASGFYYPVTNVTGIPKFNEYEVLTIKNCNGATVGTCRARGFEILDLTAVPMTYALHVFDVKYTGISYDTSWKSFHGAHFTADAFVQYEQLNGVTTAVANASATTINTSGTQFTTYKNITKLKFGNVETNLVAVVDDNQLTVSSLPAQVASGSPIYEAIHRSYGDQYSMFYLPRKPVSTLYDENNRNATKYYVRRLHQFATGTGQTTATVSLPANVGEQFVNVAELYKVIDTTGAPIAATLTISNTSITVAGLTAATTYKILLLVEKSSPAAREKKKTLKYKTVEFNTAKQVSVSEFGLGEADIYKIQSVTLSGGEAVNFTPANINDVKTYDANGEQDITTWFTLDNGQKDGYYGLGNAIKVSTAKITKPIKINFTYFEHGDGDYFSVDSYVDLPRHAIPSYDNISLADVLDFRPRIADDGSGFTAAGASYCEPLSTRDWLTVMYGAYDSGLDILNLTESGEFVVKSLTTNVEPTFASNEFNVARIYKDPYMSIASNSTVKIQYTPHKRYTMGDIAKLDQRLENVEEYVSFTLLERQLVDVEVKDKYGLDRYKAGYYTDNFTEHGPGLVSSKDYKCAMKPGNGTLCPVWDGDNIKLVEENVGNRTPQYYQVTGNHVTLPYSETVFSENGQASRPEFINPFMVWKFYGNLALFPAEDTWIDYQTLPAQYTQVGLEQRQQIVNSTAVGTVWGEWTAGPNIVSTSTQNIPPTTSVSTSYNPATTQQVQVWVPDPPPPPAPTPAPTPAPRVNNHYMSSGHAVSHKHASSIPCIHGGMSGHGV